MTLAHHSFLCYPLVIEVAVGSDDGRVYDMPYPTEFRNATLMKMRHLSIETLMSMLGRLDLLSTRREVEVVRELTRKDQLHWVLDRVIAAEKLAEFDELLNRV